MSSRMVVQRLLPERPGQRSEAHESQTSIFYLKREKFRNLLWTGTDHKGRICFSVNCTFRMDFKHLCLQDLNFLLMAVVHYIQRISRWTLPHIITTKDEDEEVNFNTARTQCSIPMNYLQDKYLTWQRATHSAVPLNRSGCLSSNPVSLATATAQYAPRTSDSPPICINKDPSGWRNRRNQSASLTLSIICKASARHNRTKQLTAPYVGAKWANW